MTIVEIEAKKTQLEVEMTTALEAAKVLEPGSPEFDEAYARHLAAKSAIAKIPDEIAKAKLAENADAIKAAAATVGEAIAQVVDGFKVADLIGVPVVALRYAIDSEGNKLVIFNPVTQARSTGLKGERKSKGAGHTMIVAPDGTRLSCTKFVTANATDAEKATQEFKYPHAVVDSKAKFDKFCESHNLTGYIYELPGAEEPAS